MHRLHSAALLVATAATAAAQGTIVSPVGTATTEGNTSNIYPLNIATAQNPRYMQIHSDLGQTPRLLRQLAWRLNGGAANYAGPRALDVELHVGHSVPWDRASWVYADNWMMPPTNVMARTTM